MIGVAMFGPMIFQIFFFETTVHWYLKSGSVLIDPTFVHKDRDVSVANTLVGMDRTSALETSKEKAAVALMNQWYSRFMDCGLCWVAG